MVVFVVVGSAVVVVDVVVDVLVVVEDVVVSVDKTNTIQDTSVKLLLLLLK